MKSILRESDEANIRELLMGHRITAVESGEFKYGDCYYQVAQGRLTLDDGTQILVAPNDGGCSCGAGDYSIEHLATVDNIITDVRLAAESDPTDQWGEPDVSYRIYVIADAAEINAVQIDGNDGNGYYGTGYELFVVPA